MNNREYHLTHHYPYDNMLYIRSCAHCRLERRLSYRNENRNRNYNINSRTIRESTDQSRIPRLTSRLINHNRSNNSNNRGSRETYLEYDRNGQIDGFQVIEPITRNRYIVEHYILSNGTRNHWYLDGLLITTGDELNENELNGNHGQIHQTFTDVIVYTTVYHLNKNTNLKNLTDLVHLTDQNCVICLESFQKDQILREIKGCKHHYHQVCFDKWAETNHRCPLCNFDFTQ